MKCKLALILIIMFITLSIPSFAVDNGYARIVYNVRGLQDYDLHWNDRFPPGSTVMIYVEADGVNHRREAAVDYIFIIKDPNNNIVDLASYSNRYHDYRVNDFLTYSRQVPTSWEDGVYTAEIHIFDLLNDSIMDKYYDDVTDAYLNGSSKPDIPLMSRQNILNLTETERQRQLINLTETFYIDRYASKYPIDRFRIENIRLDQINVAPEESVHVSATVVNTFYEKGSTSMSLLLDGNLIDETSVELEGSSSRQVAFEVSSEVIGNHTLEIVPTGSNTIGINLNTAFEVSEKKEVKLPTTFDFKDMQIDSFSVEPNKKVAISVTVQNIGKDGTQPVELYINDALEQRKDVYLNFSETKDITFNVTKTELGAYRAVIGGTNLSKLFFVESATITPTATVTPVKEKKPQFNYVLALSIFVIFMYLLRTYLKRKLK